MIKDINENGFRKTRNKKSYKFINNLLNKFTEDNEKKYTVEIDWSEKDFSTLIYSIEDVNGNLIKKESKIFYDN